MANECNFADRLCEAVPRKKSFLCCGLDPQLRYMPTHLIKEAVDQCGVTEAAIARLFFNFNKLIIDAIGDLIVAVKPNPAFYEIYGKWGIKAFEQTVMYARHRGLLIIGDGKRGDGGDTAEAYAAGWLGSVPFFGEFANPTSLTSKHSPVGVDCLTVHGYIGEACVAPFIKVAKENGKGLFVVVKTSFKPNSAVEQLKTTSGLTVWQELARMVGEWSQGWEGSFGLNNVGVVAGATYPEDANIMRRILPNAFLLKPGYGAWQNAKGQYQCASEHFPDAARKQALDDRDALISAAKQAGKWPH